MAAIPTSAGRSASRGGGPLRRSRPRHDVGGHLPAIPFRRLGESVLAALSGWMAVVTLGCGSILFVRRLSGAFSARSVADGTGLATEATGIEAAIAAALAGTLLVLFVDLLATGATVRRLPGGQRRPSHTSAAPQSPLRGKFSPWIARLGLALAVATVLPPLSVLEDRLSSSSSAATLALLAASSVALVTLVAPLASPPFDRRGPASAADRSFFPADRFPRHRRPHGGRHGRQAAPATPSQPPVPSTPEPTAPPADIDSAATCLPPLPASATLQQRFERLLLADEGVDCMRGTIHLSVAAGARSAIGHVGFCPPFHEVPHVEVGTRSEAVEAAIVAAEILPWGVRVECRLDDTADETIEIPVDVVARAPLNSNELSSPPPLRH